MDPLDDFRGSQVHRAIVIGVSGGLQGGVSRDLAQHCEARVNVRDGEPVERHVTLEAGDGVHSRSSPACLAASDGRAPAPGA